MELCWLAFEILHPRERIRAGAGEYFKVINTLEGLAGIKVVDQLTPTITRRQADIEINYKGEWFPKLQASSMFPEGWTLQRIKEECAWVYEHTVNMSSGFYRTTVTKEGKTIHHYIGKTLTCFDILIEVDDLRNIINSHTNL